MGKRGPLPRGRIKIEWSCNFAYALGLLASDGSLSRDGRHFDFTSKDKDLAVLFQRSLGLEDIKIGEKFSIVAGSKRTYYRIQFGDVNFYEWCLKCGFSPNKSKSVSKLKIPNAYFFDFLRGCFDGDGTVHSSWDTRWKKSYAFYISFTSGSEPFLIWLQGTIIRLSGAKGHIAKGGRDTYQLRYAKEGTRTVSGYMYRKEKSFRLERKFAKIQKILMIDMCN